MTEHDEEDEQFSEDPEEQLRIENELLKIKLNAELGGTFEALTNIPPEIEHEFLKNVIAFEKGHANALQQTVYEVLGKPAFVKAADLTDAAIIIELDRLEKLMEQNAMVVDYAVEYDARTRYIFLTEELFNHESAMFSMPGMTTHYIYEEFHPNHSYEITTKTEAFLTAWMEQDINAENRLLVDEFRAQDIDTDRAMQLNKVKWFFESYPTFADEHFSVKQTLFNVDENGAGTGQSTGAISYMAYDENNDFVNFVGSYTLYFTCEDNYWQINDFTVPGLSSSKP